MIIELSVRLSDCQNNLSTELVAAIAGALKPFAQLRMQLVLCRDCGLVLPEVLHLPVVRGNVEKLDEINRCELW